MSRLRRNKAEHGSYEPPARSPIGRLVAFVVLAFVAGILVVPGPAQAAIISLTSVTISDPGKGGQQARVDTRGNLLVATAVQPMTAQGVVNVNDSGNVSAIMFTVPADKRLHIQTIQALVTASDTLPTPQMIIITRTNGIEPNWRIETPNPSPGSSGPGFRSMRGLISVDLYADPGSQVIMNVSDRLAPQTQALGVLTITGVLTDAAAGVPPVNGS